ncbi:hypothetical protein ABZ079_13150 [Streptomyces sp. NPDC006314]
MPYSESPVDGTRLRYVDHGPATGPVAVFVAGRAGEQRAGPCGDPRP